MKMKEEETEAICEEELGNQEEVLLTYQKTYPSEGTKK